MSRMFKANCTLLSLDQRASRARRSAGPTRLVAAYDAECRPIDLRYAPEFHGRPVPRRASGALGWAAAVDPVSVSGDRSGTPAEPTAPLAPTWTPVAPAPSPAEGLLPRVPQPPPATQIPLPQPPSQPPGDALPPPPQPPLGPAPGPVTPPPVMSPPPVPLDGNQIAPAPSPQPERAAPTGPPTAAADPNPPRWSAEEDSAAAATFAEDDAASAAFAEDLRAILSQAKSGPGAAGPVDDALLAESQSRAANAPRYPDSGPAAEAEPEPATPRDEPGSGRAPLDHSYFDSLTHATQFDVGPIDLASAFDAFDAEIESERDRERRRAERSRMADARPAPSPSAMDAVEDLAIMDGIAGARAATAAPDGDQSFSVIHDVPLVPQQTGYSCWAAGAAMLVAWRDSVSVDPSAIAAATGYWAQYQHGLEPEDTTMFAAWGLVPEPAQSYSIVAFKSLLERWGPLWVASAEPGPHIRVVVGASGDGTPSGTSVHIADPWEAGMTTFRLPNAGARYTETYAQFEAKQATLARSETKLQGIYVAHVDRERTQR